MIVCYKLREATHRKLMLDVHFTQSLKLDNMEGGRERGKERETIITVILFIP